MQPPQDSDMPDVQKEDVEGVERSLADVEQLLVNLKERYVQVQYDQQRQVELQQRLKQVNKELRHKKRIQLKVELQQIKEQLEAIEVNLESQLFSWGSLKEPFWQAVRFGGLGIIVGWILKSWAG